MDPYVEISIENKQTNKKQKGKVHLWQQALQLPDKIVYL